MKIFEAKKVVVARGWYRVKRSLFQNNNESYGSTKKALMKSAIYFGGESLGYPGRAGIGVLIKGPSGSVLSMISRFVGVMTKNRAEYWALIAALKEARRLRLKRVRICTDSLELKRHILSRESFIPPRMVPLYRLVRKEIESFDWYKVKRVAPFKNRESRRLAKWAIHEPKVIQFPVERAHGTMEARESR